MKSLSKWFGAAAVVALLSGTAVAADATDKPADNIVAGVIAGVPAADGITVTDKDGKDHKLTVAKDADVTRDGKECKLADLKKGDAVSVTTKADDKTVAEKIAAKSAAVGPRLYFNAKVDPADDAQLWTIQKEGDHVLLISKAAKAALDANNEKGDLYLNEKVDPMNNNQLWTMKAEGDYSMFLTKNNSTLLGAKGALDANNAKDKPYINAKADANNDNELWTLEKHGDSYVLLPKGHKVALSVAPAK